MAETEPTELAFGADGMFAADLSDGLAAAMASIGTGIGLAIWFGWPIVCKVPRFCCHCCQRLSPATANPDDLDSVRFRQSAAGHRDRRQCSESNCHDARCAPASRARATWKATKLRSSGRALSIP